MKYLPWSKAPGVQRNSHKAGQPKHLDFSPRIWSWVHFFEIFRAWTQQTCWVNSLCTLTLPFSLNTTDFFPYVFINLCGIYLDFCCFILCIYPVWYCLSFSDLRSVFVYALLIGKLLDIIFSNISFVLVCHLSFWDTNFACVRMLHAFTQLFKTFKSLSSVVLTLMRPFKAFFISRTMFLISRIFIQFT